MKTIELNHDEVSFLLNATMTLKPVQVQHLDNLNVDPSVFNLVTKLKKFMSEVETPEVTEEVTATEPVTETPAVEPTPEVEPVVESAPVVEGSEVAPVEAPAHDPNDPSYS